MPLNYENVPFFLDGVESKKICCSILYCILFPILLSSPLNLSAAKV